MYPTPFSFRSIQRFGFHPEHLVTIPDQPLTNLVKQFINSLTNQSLITSWIGQLVRLIKFWTAFQSSFFVKGVGFHLKILIAIGRSVFCSRKSNQPWTFWTFEMYLLIFMPFFDSVSFNGFCGTLKSILFKLFEIAHYLSVWYFLIFYR